jgi:hypothetical protein
MGKSPAGRPTISFIPGAVSSSTISVDNVAYLVPGLSHGIKLTEVRSLNEIRIFSSVHFVHYPIHRHGVVDPEVSLSQHEVGPRETSR